MELRPLTAARANAELTVRSPQRFCLASSSPVQFAANSKVVARKRRDRSHRGGIHTPTRFALQRSGQQR